MALSRKFVRRRRVPRREFIRKIGLLWKGNYSLCLAVQIGEGGLMFQSAFDIKENQKLVISFSIPGGQPVVVRGTILFVMAPDKKNPLPRYGAQFENLDFNAKRQIRNYVAAKEVGEAPASTED